jgi:hypothetical protein
MAAGCTPIVSTLPETDGGSTALALDTDCGCTPAGAATGSAWLSGNPDTAGELVVESAADVSVWLLLAEERHDASSRIRPRATTRTGFTEP